MWFSRKKQGITDEELKDWFNRGVQNGMAFSDMKDILVNRGMNQEAGKLTEMFIEKVRKEEKEMHPRINHFSTRTALIMVVIVLFLLALGALWYLNSKATGQAVKSVGTELNQQKKANGAVLFLGIGTWIAMVAMILVALTIRRIRMTRKMEYRKLLYD